MYPFRLFPCEMKVPCDTFQCHGRAAYFIGKEDAPKSMLTKVCEKCANELIDGVLETHRAEAATVPVEVELMPFQGVVNHVLESMSYLELKAYAKEHGLTGYSDKNKAELIALIEGAE